MTLKKPQSNNKNIQEIEQRIKLCDKIKHPFFKKRKPSTKHINFAQVHKV